MKVSNGQWKLASTTSRGRPARLVSVPARDIARVLQKSGTDLALRCMSFAVFAVCVADCRAAV